VNRLQLYRLLRKNNKLSYRRSPLFEQGTAAKVLLALGSGMFIIYLILYGSIMGMAVERGEYGTLMAFMPFVLVIDFLLRFLVQQTPDMMVKPYILQPISKYTVIECFLLSSLGSAYNWLWLAMFIPYSIIALAAGCPVAGVLLTLITAELLIMLNSQIYLMLRTLIGRNILWWFAAIPIYALLFLPWILDLSEDGFERMAEMYTATGGTVWLLAGVVVALFIMLWVNRQMQFAFVYEELSRQQKKSTLRHVSQFSFLTRFGQTGEYLKIEVKSVMRNKMMRSRFWVSFAAIVVFCALIAYTPIYDGTAMTNFWCFYCFAIYGVTSLTKVMAAEGNYIDLLMTHHENILTLLKAKYYFHCAMLLIPLVIMLPAVINGKFTILMVLAYMFYSSGLLHFIMFQLAVYNKQTLPLDQKLTGKGNFENGVQLAIELTAMFLPVVIVAVLMLLFNATTAYIILALIGLLFTITSPLWLRNIYQRMMRRKYVNLEGFHATR